MPSSQQRHLVLDPSQQLSPLERPDHSPGTSQLELPLAKHTHHHHTAPIPSAVSTDASNASLYFIGTATVVLEWAGLRIMTDPNFLHAGDHVHLGSSVTAMRMTDPAVNLEDLPPVDAVLLSHFHEDHFDKLVQESLRKSLPIITTPHAKESLTALGFTSVEALDSWDSIKLTQASSSTITVTATPGEHVAGPIISKVNELMGAVPPTAGWMIEMKKAQGAEKAYRIYISGDTLMVDKLKEIPERFPKVDLLLIHLGGTTIPGPYMPVLMVTMDAIQGVQLVKLIKPKVTLPIHYDDYDVFLSPLEDFKKEMAGAGLSEDVVWWERGDRFDFGLE